VPAYTYIGDGSSNPSNVPAGDISAADWEAFDEIQQASVVAHSDPSPTASAQQLYEESGTPG
jgi:hypothetical protein